MRRWPWGVVVAVLSACPPPVGQTCDRPPVLNVIRPTGERLFPVLPTLTMAGVPTTVKVVAPLMACVGEQPSASARLFDGANVEAPAPTLSSVTSEEVSTNVGSIVTATLSFTPATPGRYSLQVAFEPSLGVRSLVVDVAEAGASGPSVRVPLPEKCDAGVWPLGPDGIACEERLPATVKLAWSDGGTEAFPGMGLAVAGQVLWSVDFTGTLQRRVLTDAGLVLTHQAAGFARETLPALHDEDVAIRRSSEGGLYVLRVLDGGLRPDVAAPASAGALFLEDALRASESCANACPGSRDLLGIEPGVVWTWAPDALSADRTTQPSIAGYARPARGFEPPLLTLPYAPNPESPTGFFERSPLWLTPDVPLEGGLEVVAWLAPEGLRFTAWRRPDVLRLGRGVALLRAPQPGYVQVISTH